MMDRLEKTIGLGLDNGCSAVVATNGGDVRLVLREVNPSIQFPTVMTCRDALALAHGLIACALAAGVGK